MPPSGSRQILLQPTVQPQPERPTQPVAHPPGQHPLRIPKPAVVAPMEPARTAWTRTHVALFAAAFVVPAFLLLGLEYAHDALDQPQPEVVLARGLLLGVAILGVMSAVAGIAWAVLRRRWWFLLALAPAALAAPWAAYFGHYGAWVCSGFFFATSCSRENPVKALAFLATLFVLPTLLVALAAVSPKRPWAPLLPIVALMAIGATFGTMAIILLVRLDQEGQHAAQAYVRTPSAGLLMVLSVLALAALHRRTKLP